MTRGIPTRYAGIRFRSRLEARWAMCFDMLGWGYEYEPIDCDGWIPDFLLKLSTPVLVEIKPELTLNGLEQHCEKIDYANATDEVLLLGASLLYPATNFDMPVLGLLREVLTERDGQPYDSAWGQALAFRCAGPRAHGLGFSHADQSWKCRVCGHYDGGHSMDALRDYQNTLRAMWVEAGNSTQWKAQ
jgi:hypothetical protein